MKAFEVKGSFQMGRVKTPFTIETASADENGAREKVFSDLGSRHRVERRYIEITSVTAVSADDLQDLAVKRRVELSKQGA